MVEVKVLKDGKIIKELSGEVAFAVTMEGDDEALRIRSTIRGSVAPSTFLKGLAFACAKNIVDIFEKYGEDAVEAIALFKHYIRQYGAQYLDDKYGEREAADYDE